MQKRCPLALFLFLSLFPVSSAELRFEPVVVTQGQVTLGLTGDAGVSYVVESSLDLTNWTAFSSGVLTNGTIDIFDVHPASAEFYRARTIGSLPEPLSIVPQAHSNNISSLAVTDEPAELDVFRPDGKRIILSFPSNSVVVPQEVKMTLLTNIGSLPFSGGWLGAVRIELADIEMYGPGLLEMSIPTNIDRRQIVSFTSELDGSELSLALDRVWNDRVSIPVTRAGIYGTAVATTQEVARVMAPYEALRSANAILPTGEGGRLRASIATSLICYPQEVADAQRARDQIRQKIRLEERMMSQFIATKRSGALLGMQEDSGAIFDNLLSQSCDFYRENVGPHWEAGATNCYFNMELLKITYGFERQFQLLGVTGAANCTRPQVENLCTGLSNCLEELKQCCQTMSQGRDRIRDLFVLMRQAALAGVQPGSCPGLSEAAQQEVMEVCSDVTWSGLFSSKDTGSTNYTITHTGGYVETKETFNVQFEGYVVNATERSMGPLGYSVELKVGGSIFGKKFFREYGITDNRCGPIISLREYDEFARTNGFYRVNLTIQPGVNYVIGGGYSGNDEGTFTADGKEKSRNVSTNPGGIGCEGYGQRITTDESEAQFLAAPLFPVTFPIDAGATNVVKGTTNVAGLLPSVHSRATFQWNLQRKKDRPLPTGF